MPATTVYASIGNSDDKLTQREWADYADQFMHLISGAAEQVHGRWYSSPASPFQNACVCFEIAPAAVDLLQDALTDLRRRYRQDSIAWATAATEFI